MGDDIDWRGLESGEAMRMRVFPASTLPQTPAARIELVMDLLLGPVIVDDNDQPTGERGPPLITKEQARRLLGDL